MEVLSFISRYRLKQLRKKQLQGKKLWWRLNNQLPQAYGVIEDDCPRMKAFMQILPTLKTREKNALKAWLKAEIYDLEHNFCEHATMREEEYERRLKQIYRTHLEAMS